MGCYPNNHLKTLPMFIMIHVPREFSVVHPGMIPIGFNFLMSRISPCDFRDQPENAPG